MIQVLAEISSDGGEMEIVSEQSDIRADDDVITAAT